MNSIESTINPIIGERYLVKTIKFIRNGLLLEWPVFSDFHKDNKQDNLLEEEHYHIDWRFMEEKYVEEHRKHNQKLSNKWKNTNAEYYSPIMKREMIGEVYKEWMYLRDFDIPEIDNSSLRIRLKRSRMRNFICPHHGTNLKSCKAINNVLVCPQHGLKWNVKTGELV